MSNNYPDLPSQLYYIGRIERRIEFLKARLNGTATRPISQVNYADRVKYETMELKALEWAASELRKVYETNQNMIRHLSRVVREPTLADIRSYRCKSRPPEPCTCEDGTHL